MNGHKRKSAIPTTTDDAAEETSTFQSPPSFRLDDDFAAESNGSSKNNASSRYELWTVRLPQAVDSDDVNGLELSVADPSSQNFESNGLKYTFQWGHPVENESFRLLLPKSKVEKDKKGSDSDSDDESDDDDEQYYLYPTKVPFTRHVNVVAAVPLQAETELAPRIDNAPAALVPIRRAYHHVPQKKGLKRRWMPLGSALAEPKAQGAVAVPSTPERKSKTGSKSPARAPASPPAAARPPVAMNIKEEPTSSAPDSDSKLEKSARKEAKRAKKEAKKAKKESKVKKEPL
jgi:hypothetical protein